LFGVDPDPHRAVASLAERLATSDSVDDVVAAVADVTRLSMGATAGALEVHDAERGVESRWWPETFHDVTLPRILVHSDGEVVGAVRVRKVTGVGLTRREAASVEALGTAAVGALRSRFDPRRLSASD
jgi:hypothetical protein